MSQDNLSLLNANLDDTIRPLFADKYFLGAVALFFALYAGWLAPKLPNSVIYFFDTIPGKLLFIFIIAFVASRRVENSFQVALVVSVMFLVTLTVLNKVKMQEAFQNLSMEHFNLMGTMENLMKGQQQENYLTPEEEAAAKAKAAADEAARLKAEADEKAKTDNMAKASASSPPSPPAEGSSGGKCRTAEPKCSNDLECNPTNDKCEEKKSLPGPAENFEAFSNYSQYSDY
jgi:hypothetical protein